MFSTDLMHIYATFAEDYLVTF